MPVSYTHLDVYKRQVQFFIFPYSPSITFFNCAKCPAQDFSFTPSQLVLITFWEGPCFTAMFGAPCSFKPIFFGLSFSQLIYKYFYIGKNIRKAFFPE